MNEDKINFLSMLLDNNLISQASNLDRSKKKYYT